MTDVHHGGSQNPAYRSAFFFFFSSVKSVPGLSSRGVRSITLRSVPSSLKCTCVNFCLPIFVERILRILLISVTVSFCPPEMMSASPLTSMAQSCFLTRVVRCNNTMEEKNKGRLSQIKWINTIELKANRKLRL